MSSGLCDLKLMKTAMSGFKGFIQDEYTNLKPVGEGAASPDRIMCTELEAQWSHASDAADFAAVNARVRQLILETYAGDPVEGVFSLSLQQTVYRIARAVLDELAGIESIRLITPNVHFYTWAAHEFGLENPNLVFQSTDCHSTASGRITTFVSRRAAAKL